MPKISFDYDGVLTTENGKQLLKRKISEGYDVYIVTARRHSLTVINFARQNGVPSNRVFFTEGEDKWKTLQRLGIETHYDNNQEQIDKINKFTNTKGILYGATA